MHGSFFDTNVVMYVASADPVKANRAEALIAEGGVISVQVLNELANVARRKMALTWEETRTFLEMVRALLPVRPLTVELHQIGIGLAERYGFSVHDAMIVAAALEAECTTLWSEDMQHGMKIDNRLLIANPFGITES